mgnify:FL=1
MKNLKGILLAGGRGTRLYPLTALLNKQLQPVYDKPMVYYPLSTLMLAGIRDILIISTPEDIPNFQKLLGDGSTWGISLSYAFQDEPRGIADAFLIGKDFIQKEAVCLILGDNLFYGYLDFLRDAINNNTGGTIFGYQVKNPQEYGVVDFDEIGNVISIEEKPEIPKSNYAIPGLYVYDSNVVEMVKQITPSARGELEITDLNKVYLSKKQLKVELIGRGIAWLDMGTPDSLLEAGEFIQLIETRQGLKIGCLEEVAFSSGYINAEKFEQIVADTPNGPYREYLKKVKLT